MQERYLGDSHDFIKYALLRHLATTLGLRLGVNWYLTEPTQVDRPGNNDGAKRHHLRGKGWAETDPDLFTRIARFQKPEARRLENVTRFELLPSGTLYHDAVITSERAEWHLSAQKNLRDSEIVFLDPDNGFDVPSTTRRTAPKYALYREAADFAASGKVVVGIRFARQCDPVKRAVDVRARLANECGATPTLPVVRARLAPNILFIAVSPPEREVEIGPALESFVARCSKAELIPAITGSASI